MYLHAGRQGREEGINISTCRQAKKGGRDEYIYMQARKEGRERRMKDEYIYMQARKEGRKG
jgi:hypothetical protein